MPQWISMQDDTTVTNLVMLYCCETCTEALSDKYKSCVLTSEFKAFRIFH